MKIVGTQDAIITLSLMTAAHLQTILNIAHTAVKNLKKIVNSNLSCRYKRNYIELGVVKLINPDYIKCQSED